VSRQRDREYSHLLPDCNASGDGSTAASVLGGYNKEQSQDFHPRFQTRSRGSCPEVNMARRKVYCAVLKKEAEGLERPPYPGRLGQRIYENVSREGWMQWLQRLTMIINENQLSTADPGSVHEIEKHMLGFLFGEGDYGALPAGFQPAGAKK
jgi:Fe-S cluster biosynthesis and repair protein YggX